MYQVKKEIKGFDQYLVILMMCCNFWLGFHQDYDSYFVKENYQQRFLQVYWMFDGLQNYLKQVAREEEIIFLKVILNEKLTE